MDESKILFNKDGLQFIKLTKNTYKLQFQMENNTMDLSKIIDFSLIKLIYDLNPDIYEKVNVEKHNENEHQEIEIGILNASRLYFLKAISVITQSPVFR